MPSPFGVDKPILVVRARRRQVVGNLLPPSFRRSHERESLPKRVTLQMISMYQWELTTGSDEKTSRVMQKSLELELPVLRGHLQRTGRFCIACLLVVDHRQRQTISYTCHLLVPLRGRQKRTYPSYQEVPKIDDESPAACFHGPVL